MLPAFPVDKGKTFHRSQEAVPDVRIARRDAERETADFRANGDPVKMRRPLLSLLIPGVILAGLHGDRVCRSNASNYADADADFSILEQRSRPEPILSRRRRLTFPTGSTFVMTVSILQAVPLKLPTNWNLDFEFDVIWPIPLDQKKHRKKIFVRRPWMVKRRHRRELYATFETALNSRKLPGRECILRAICEARVLLSPPGVSFIEDTIRLILRNVENVEEMDEYDVAYRRKDACDAVYTCPVSLLKLLLFHLYPDGPG